MVFKLVVSEQEYARWVRGDADLDTARAEILVRLQHLAAATPLIALFHPIEAAQLTTFLACKRPHCDGAGVPHSVFPWANAKGWLAGYCLVTLCKKCGGGGGSHRGGLIVYPIPPSLAWYAGITGECPTCPPDTEQTPNPETKEVTCSGCNYTTSDGIEWWRA